MPAPAPRGRDLSWALVVLAAVPLVVHSLGTPLGEPFADDFFFLRRVLFPGPRPLLDGGGSPLYWRPLGRQAYYGALGEAIVAHPRAIAALHVALLVAAALLVHRTLRRRWPGAVSAAAASFPLLVESARMLIGWPSHFQDVGALAFAALALHEAAGARLVTMLAALLASLLCKEVGVVTALLVPWLPVGEASRAWRVRATLATAALVAAWGAAYVAVTQHAGVGFAHQFGGGAAASGASLPARGAWAVAHSLRSAFSLPAAPGPWDLPVGLALAALLAAAVFVFATRPAALARLRDARALVLWGAAWFAAATVPLLEVYPAWSAQRCVFASAGLGLAFGGLLAAASPWLLAPLVVLRLSTFAVSPPGSPAITPQPPDAGGEFEYRQFARLQWFTHDTRALLSERFPMLPHGAVIGDHGLPLLTRHALAGDLALRVWYRDTTLRWLTFEDYRGRWNDPGTRVAAFVEYQPRGPRPLALVDGAAMADVFEAGERMRQAAWADAAAALERAAQAQRDTAAAVFLGLVASKRAVCELELGERQLAERSAVRGLELWPENADSRYTLAELRLAEGAYARAETLLVEQLRLHPEDAAATQLLERVRRDAQARTGH